MTPPDSILFVSLGSEAFGPCPAAVVLSSAIERCESLSRRPRCQFRDVVLRRTSLEQVLWSILDSHTEAVALPIYSWNAVSAAQLIDGLRTASPELPILAGGAGLPLLPPESRRQLSLAVDGHGEEPLLSWLGASDRSPSLLDLFDSTLPYAERSDDYVSSFPDKSVICYDASRGCPFRCSFCIEGSPSRKPLRRPWPILERELAYLAAVGYELIDVADNNANQDPYALAAYIASAERHPSTRFHFEARAEFFTQQQCERLRPRANVQVFLGVQSLSQQELLLARRPQSMTKLSTVMCDWLRPGTRALFVGLDLIFGMPGQTLGSFARSFDDAARLYPDRINLNHYQAYDYEHRGGDNPTGDGILSACFMKKVARRASLPLDEVLTLVKFKSIFQCLQRRQQWTAAANTLLLNGGRSPATFYLEMAERSLVGCSEVDVYEIADTAISRHLGPQASALLRQIIDDRVDATAGHPLFPSLPARSCARALSTISVKAQ